MQKLNWLYPNFLRKIDHYLKINYPNIWRTRVHDFGWFSLILGNGLAVLAGIFMVGRDNVLSEGNIYMMHLGLTAMLVFVGLFWAMQLLRFKIKFPNFKTMLTTWLIYVFCVGSLGLNLATFTSTIAYRTAYIYSDKVVQGDEALLQSYDAFNSFKNMDHMYRHRYTDGYVTDEYRTPELLITMARHGYTYSKNDKIYRKEIKEVTNIVEMLKEAKVFVWEPIIGKNFKNYEKKSMYHVLLNMHWTIGGVLLFFLPTLLFLVSLFGVRNILISIFITAVLVGLATMLVSMFKFDYMHGRLEQELFTMAYAFMAFILAMVLAGGRRNLRSWNYIAGVFMLMLGVVFFASFLLCVENYHLYQNPLFEALKILPFSILVSLGVAWAVAKRNDMPVLR